MLLFLLLSLGSRSQYVLNGTATQLSCNCYQLTGNATYQNGSVWNRNKIDLSRSFDFWFKVNFGCNDNNGADGMVFMLQPLSTSIGTSGEGMGFSGITPSIGISMDTYRNAHLSDPDFDHISIQANGVIAHGTDLAGPVTIAENSNNVEDCQWHRLRITWDATTHWLRAYFDGVLRVEKQQDLVATIFQNDPMVYWGFSGGTGGLFNVQQFCTALEPQFGSGGSQLRGCEGSPVSFSDQSVSFAPIASYAWSFGDGGTSSLPQPLPYTYGSPGRYPVTLTITGLDGCVSTKTDTILIGSLPVAAFTVGDTCEGKPPKIGFTPGTALQYSWVLDGTALPADAIQGPVLPLMPAGGHRLEQTVTSTAGCGTPAQLQRSFSLFPRPWISALTPDGCINTPLALTAQQIDNRTQVVDWYWGVPMRASPVSGQVVQLQFRDSGSYQVSLWGITTQGCSSDTVRQRFRINGARLQVEDHFTVIRHTPTPLPVVSNGPVSWQPIAGLSVSPTGGLTATLGTDQNYLLTVTTPEGCRASDSIRIKVFDGPEIYVPTAFTPNGDGKNDAIRPVYVGLRSLERFAIYDRWGRVVFSTRDTRQGWDGSSGNQGGGTQTFVWLASGTDYMGRPLVKKGTITLIR